MNSLIAAYVFIIGLCIGSFLNVVILRGLKGEDFIFGSSRCPKCSNSLRWYMNIPLVSYIFLRGKCAFCHEKISIQYPIVELLTGCGFLASFLTFGLSYKTLFLCIILSLFMVLAVTDILETVIIDIHAYILFVVAILYSLFVNGDVTILQAIIGGVLGFVLFEGTARLGYLIANFRMFGEGDSLIALGLGAIFGIENFLIIAGLSVLLQCLYSIPVLVKKAYSKGNYRLLSSYVIVFVSLFVVIYLNCFDVIKNNITYTGYVILIICALVWSLKNIISSVKNKKEIDFEEAKEKFSLFPFGPAMIIAAIIGIFYLEQIKIVIKTFLY